MPTLQSIIASAPKRATPDPLRSTKAAIAICAVLPFFVYADYISDLQSHLLETSTRVNYSLYVCDPDSNSLVDSGDNYSGSPSGVLGFIQTRYIGLAFYKGSSDVYRPVLANSALGSPSYTRPFTCHSFTNQNFGFYYFPSVRNYFNFVGSLYSYGYRGDSLRVVRSASSYDYVDFNFSLFVNDVLFGTNTSYKSLLLGYLGSINGSVSSISQSVGTINSDYRAVNDIYLNPSYSNIAARAAYYNGLGGNGLFLHTYLPNHPDEAPEIAKAVLENARRNVGYILNACRDPDSPFYGSSFEDIVNDPDDFDKAISVGGGGSVLSQFVNDIQKARQAGENFNKGINDRLDGISSALVGSQGSDAPSIMGILGGGGSGGDGGLAGDIKRLSTNDWASAVTNQLAENTAGITNRLAQNTRDVKDALANMFGPATNDVHQVAQDVHDNLGDIKNYNERSAEAAESIDRHLREDRIKVEVDGINVGFVLEEPVTIEQTQFNGVSLPLAGISQRLEDWQAQWLHWFNYDDYSYHWYNYYQMVSRIESSITNLVFTNDFQRYYFDRFKQADNFTDKDEQLFHIDDACDLVFGNGFDIGEYNKLNWFSRVELLLYKVSSVTNTLETTDITSITNEVNTLNLNVTNFVNTSVKVVGVFKLIDGFAKSMRSAFSGYSSPQTSGVVLLEAGHWIGDEALVLKVPVEVQNALRLVFECIWYLSAFVVGWRILVWSWDRIVSLMRWLWSLIDI